MPAVSQSVAQAMSGASWLNSPPQSTQALTAIYARERIEIAKSTLCSWHEQLNMLCRLLVEAMHKDALNV